MKQLEACRYYEDSRMLYAELSVVMGTKLEFLVLGSSKDKALSVWENVKKETNRLDRMLNRFDPDSLVSRINREAWKAPVVLSDEMFSIIAECKRYWQLTEHCFDITLKDSSLIHLEESRNMFSFLSADIYIDLGGFAKGYALRKIRQILRSADITQALVNFGNSTVLALGKHPYGDAWPIGAYDPYEEGEVLAEFMLSDNVLSTSGNMPSHPVHIVNPANGKFVEGRKMVCVVCPDEVDAEVLSTALMVAIPEQEKKILFLRLSGKDIFYE